MNKNNIVRYFLSGLIFIIPVYITYQVIVKLSALTGDIFPKMNILFSFFLSIIILILLGYFISKIFNRRYRNRIQQKSEETGVLGRIFYLISHYKETSEKTKKAFSRPVLYKVDTGIYKLGFITCESQKIFENSDEADISPSPDAVWVYAPFPINFLGEFLLVEKANIKKLDKKKEEIVPFILSAGIFSKEDKLQDQE